MYGDEEEALFHSYPHAMYFVQSPSTVSHANSTDCRNPDSAFLSPFNPTPSNPNPTPNNPNTSISTVHCPEVSRFTLSRYSSSRGSNNSFLHDKKIPYDLRSHGNGADSVDNRMIDGPDEEEGDDDEGGDGRDGIFPSGGGGGPRRRPSSSLLCVCFQIMWRMMVSLGVAMLVFFLFTKPPPPKMSVQMAGIRQFGLGEGTDNSGVVTKILTSNCSLDLEIENRSKFFGLHLRPPTIDIAFGRLTFATSLGPALYVEADSLETFRLYVGTKNKAMYGAGRDMQDMLESGKGLPLIIRVRLRSSIRVIWNIVRPRYRHHAECLLVLGGTYDRRHHSHAYNSTCTTSS
ncbi:uncharacterized protein LOC131221236 [Magnolia sinica]|uniref:uncharacterized protein LOC131221236 n=1 Tax=Magnolia sinica TaxID=86752 RepID=UPI002658C212|nr:uncharacterized protein LOC131221236 [Magnolia sinica]